ncbi:carboxypeptidase-like regulatory domain-containing protein [Novipirellula artificiosorum]|uniref:Cna protein B-type domain protein n=1 Tax=Novipirellula artificiosorum TaxID=2528016 RepID=A0A5C6DFL0_9BACT|nr:carboxypeptidase-like regulatory domain-containing protein [Novipirellula artificiosorum]TWU33916.1 Cna protein B-type domain protein [Novipirellula artificiosorum]
MSNSLRHLSFLLSAFLLLALDCQLASALIMGGTGNKPVRDAGWPRGAIEVANLTTRIAWWEGPPFGGGEWHFEYRGTTAELQAAVDAFSNVLAPRLELVVHDGTHESFWIKTSDKQADASVNWVFTVWVPANWNHLYNNPRSYFSADQPNFRQPVAAPRLDVYVGGQIDWKAIRLPSNVVVTDSRLEANGFAPDAGGVIQGIVWDMATGKPIAAARVRVGDDVVTGETDADGRFTIERIPAAGYFIVIDADGYAPKRIEWTTVTRTSFQRFDVYLSEAKELRGQVVNVDGQPLSEVKVRLSNVVAVNGLGYPSGGESTVMTDNDGQFVFGALPQGIVQLACHKEGYYYNSVLNEHHIDDSPLTLQMVRSGQVDISVVDAQGLPITSKFIVELEPEGGLRVGSWGGSSNVGDDGTVTFKGIPPGQYHVWGKPNPGRADAKTKVHPVTIAGDDKHTIELHLE